MENIYPKSRIVKTLRWLAVVPVALGIQLIFAFALMRPLDALPVNRERVSSFVFGLCELICLGIASFASGGVAPNRRSFAAALGGGSILFIELLSFFETLGNGSPDQDRGSAEVTALGFCGVAAATAVWFMLDKARKQRASPSRADGTSSDDVYPA
jgi:hypothetical protein